MDQSIDIHEGDLLIRTNSEEDITLVVRNEFIPEGDHIEIKVTKDGVKIERWDVSRNQFVQAYAVDFAEDFNNEGDIYEDEPEDDEPEDDQEAVA